MQNFIKNLKIIFFPFNLNCIQEEYIYIYIKRIISNIDIKTRFAIIKTEIKYLTNLFSFLKECFRFCMKKK